MELSSSNLSTLLSLPYLSESQFFRIAYHYQKHQKYEEATLCFQKILKNDPENIVALSGIGYCYEVQGKYVAALKAYHKSIQKVEEAPQIEDLDENMKEIYLFCLFKAGWLYLVLREFQMSIKYLSKTITLQSNFFPSYIGLAQSYFSLSKQSFSQGNYLQSLYYLNSSFFIVSDHLLSSPTHIETPSFLSYSFSDSLSEMRLVRKLFADVSLFYFFIPPLGGNPNRLLSSCVYPRTEETNNKGEEKENEGTYLGEIHTYYKKIIERVSLARDMYQNLLDQVLLHESNRMKIPSEPSSSTFLSEISPSTSSLIVSDSFYDLGLCHFYLKILYERTLHTITNEKESTKKELEEKRLHHRKQSEENFIKSIVGQREQDTNHRIGGAGDNYSRGWIGLGELVEEPNFKQHCFIKAVESNKNSVRGWNHLGLFYLKYNISHLARKCFLQAQSVAVGGSRRENESTGNLLDEEEDERSKCWIGEGILNECKGWLKEAKENYLVGAVGDESGSDSAGGNDSSYGVSNNVVSSSSHLNRLGLGFTSYAVRDIQTSFSSLRSFLSQNPFSIDAHNLFSLCSESLSLLPLSLSHLSTALSLLSLPLTTSPSPSKIQQPGISSPKTLHTLQDMKEGSFMDTEKKREYIRLNVSRILCTQGRYDESISELLSLFKQNPSLPQSPYPLLQLAAAYCGKGKYTETQGILQKALSLLGNEDQHTKILKSSILRGLSQVQYLQGNLPQSKQTIAQCIKEEEGKSVESWRQMSALAILLDDKAAAAHVIQKVMAIDSTSEHSISLSLSFCLINNDLLGALKLVKKGIHMYPHSSHWWKQYASLIISSSSSSSSSDTSTKTPSLPINELYKLSELSRILFPPTISSYVKRSTKKSHRGSEKEKNQNNLFVDKSIVSKELEFVGFVHLNLGYLLSSYSSPSTVSLSSNNQNSSNSPQTLRSPATMLNTFSSLSILNFVQPLVSKQKNGENEEQSFESSQLPLPSLSKFLFHSFHTDPTNHKSLYLLSISFYCTLLHPSTSIHYDSSTDTLIQHWNSLIKILLVLKTDRDRDLKQISKRKEEIEKQKEDIEKQQRELEMLREQKIETERMVVTINFVLSDCLLHLFQLVLKIETSGTQEKLNPQQERTKQQAVLIEKLMQENLTLVSQWADSSMTKEIDQSRQQESKWLIHRQLSKYRLVVCNDSKSAIEILKKYIKSNPSHKPCLELGDLYLRGGEYKAAESCFKLAVSLTNQQKDLQVVPLLRLSLLYYHYFERESNNNNTGKKKENTLNSSKFAIDSVDRAARIQPNNPQIVFLQAFLYQKLGKNKSAEKTQQALDLEPSLKLTFPQLFQSHNT